MFELRLPLEQRILPAVSSWSFEGRGQLTLHLVKEVNASWSQLCARAAEGERRGAVTTWHEMLDTITAEEKKNPPPRGDAAAGKGKGDAAAGKGKGDAGKEPVKDEAAAAAPKESASKPQPKARAESPSGGASAKKSKRRRRRAPSDLCLLGLQTAGSPRCSGSPRLGTVLSRRAQPSRGDGSRSGRVGSSVCDIG